MKTNDVLRWSIIGGALLALCVPLFVANSLFFPFITGKAFAFRIIVEIMLGLWLILALRDPSARPRKSFLLYAGGAFVLSLLVSVFLSANPDKSFWSNFERMEGWIGIAHVVAYFGILFSVFTAERFWKWFWNTTIAVSVVEGLYGLSQLLGWAQIHQGGVRVDGTFGNATYLAIYMVLSFFMTLLAGVWWARPAESGKRGKVWLTWGYAAALVLQVVIIFYTATRGAILGLFAGIFVAGIVFLLSGGGSRTLRRWGIGALVVITVAYGAFLAVDQTSFVKNHEVLSRVASIDTPQKLLEQGSTRFAIWGMAGEGFLDRPIFGWGQESFNYLFNQFYSPSLYAQEPWFDRAHNEFLDMLVAGGAVGFLLYVSLFGVALWYLFRRDTFNPMERGLFAGLLTAYAVNNLFVFDNLMSYVLFFSVLAYLAYRAVPQDGAVLGGSFRMSPESANIAAPIVAVIMVAVLYFVNVPGITAASDVIQGLTSHPEGLQTNLDYLKKAISASAGGGLGSQEVHEQLMQFAAQAKNLNAGDQQFQADVQNYVIARMKEQVAATPNDARIRLFFGTYLLQIGSLADARTELLAAHTLSPGKQQVLFELGALDASAGNYPAALSWLKQAYDSEPRFDGARTAYAAIAIQAGERALASSLLMPRFGTLTPDDNMLLSAYLSVKDYPSVLSILKGRVEKDPNSAQNHQQLAAGYLQAGDKADAIAELREAIRLDPSFAQQGQYYIQQIQAQ